LIGETTASGILAKSGLKGNKPDLETHALEYLENGPILVRELHHELGKQTRVDAWDVTKMVLRLVEQGRAELTDAPPAAKSFKEYLGMWDENLWLYFSVGITSISFLASLWVSTNSLLVAFRWIAGCALVLFAPGYVIVEALFPNKAKLDQVMRCALSIGLSLVLVMIVGLLLSYTAEGITMIPTITALTVLMAGLVSVALVRKYRHLTA